MNEWLTIELYHIVLWFVTVTIPKGQNMYTGVEKWQRFQRSSVAELYGAALSGFKSCLITKATGQSAAQKVVFFAKESEWTGAKTVFAFYCVFWLYTVKT